MQCETRWHSASFTLAWHGAQTWNAGGCRPTRTSRGWPVGGLGGELTDQPAHRRLSDTAAARQPCASSHPGDVQVFDAHDVEAASQPAGQLMQEQLAGRGDTPVQLLTPPDELGPVLRVLFAAGDGPVEPAQPRQMVPEYPQVGGMAVLVGQPCHRTVQGSQMGAPER